MLVEVYIRVTSTCQRVPSACFGLHRQAACKCIATTSDDDCDSAYLEVLAHYHHSTQGRSRWSLIPTAHAAQPPRRSCCVGRATSAPRGTFGSRRRPAHLHHQRRRIQQDVLLLLLILHQRSLLLLKKPLRPRRPPARGFSAAVGRRQGVAAMTHLRSRPEQAAYARGWPLPSADSRAAMQLLATD